MKINLKKVLLAGTAIVAIGAINVPDEAYAQCATGGAIAADCDFIDSATSAALTLADGVDITFTSSTSQISIDHTIDATNANGNSTILTGGNGTIVYQSAAIGSTTELGAFTLNSGDIWFVSSSSINLASAGTFTVDGGTLNLVNGSSINDSVIPGTFSGGSSADTINFGSADLAYSGTSDIIYASAFDLADGADTINFASTSDGILMVSSFSMGAGNDTISFSSGHIQSSSSLDLGTGDDTITFASAEAGQEGGLMEGASFDAGGGDDSITFNNSGEIDLSSSNGTLSMGAGNDTITFNSTDANFGGVIGEIDLGTGTLDMGAGTDTVTFNSGGSLTAGAIVGGDGTDTINYNSGTYSTGSADISGVEAINVTDSALTIGGSITDGTITLASTTGGLAASLTINDGGAGDTVSSTITAGDGNQTVTLTQGTVTGSISLGGDNDTINYQSGSLTGAISMGGGDDTLNVALNADVAISNTVSGVETVNIQGTNTLTLSAAITGVDSATQTGLDVAGGTLKINNGGSVSGTIYDSGAGTVEFGANGSGGTFNIGGLIENVTLTVTSGTVSTNGNALGAGGQTLAALNIAAGSTFNAGDNVTTGGALDMDGTLNIDAGDTVTADSVDADGTGTYDFAVSNNAGTLTSGSLVISGVGNVDLSAGETVQFGISSSSQPLVDGSTVIFASATGGGVAVAPAAWTDDSFLFDFSVGLVNANKALELTVNQAITLAEATTTNNNLVAAEALLTDPAVTSTTDSVLLELVADASGAPDAATLNEVLEQAQPTIDGSHIATALTVVNNAFDIMDDRLSFLRTGDRVTGMTTGNLTRGLRIWGQGFAVKGEQDRRNGIDGYDFDTYGVSAGMDTENIAEDTVIGIAFNYANTDADSDNASQTNTEIDSYQLAVYGDHDINSRMYVNGMVAYSWNDNEIARQVASARAKGEFDATQFTTRAELGRDYSFRHATVTPHVLGHWTHYNPDGYTETNAGNAGRVVSGDALDVIELGIGADVNWLFRNSNGSYFSPELGFGYRYDFADDRITMNSRFIEPGATSIRTEGFDPQQHTFDTNIGFTYYSRENWEMTTAYDYEWKEDFSAHAAMFRADYRF